MTLPNSDPNNGKASYHLKKVSMLVWTSPGRHSLRGRLPAYHINKQTNKLHKPVGGRKAAKQFLIGTCHDLRRCI